MKRFHYGKKTLMLWKIPFSFLMHLFISTLLSHVKHRDPRSQLTAVQTCLFTKGATSTYISGGLCVKLSLNLHIQAFSGRHSTVAAKQTFPKLQLSQPDKTTKEPQLRPFEIINVTGGIQQTLTWTKSPAHMFIELLLYCCSSDQV